LVGRRSLRAATFVATVLNVVGATEGSALATGAAAVAGACIAAAATSTTAALRAMTGATRRIEPP
jgi:hypothetical protein